MVKLEGRTRLLAGLAALGVVIGGGWLSTGTPSLIAVNDGISVSYPWPRGLGSLLCAGGLILLTRAARKTLVSVVGLLLAIVAAGGALYLWTYRVDADGDSIAARRYFRTQTIAWGEITHVGTDAGIVVLSGVNGRKIAIDTTDFSPAQRMILGRTIARRINEASGAVALALGTSHPRTP